MNLKSKGFNRLIHDLFDQFPNKPSQKKYRQQLRDCLRIVLINLNNTNDYISYSRDDHAPEYKVRRYSAKNIRKVVEFLEYVGLIEDKMGYNFSANRELNRMSRIRSLDELIKLFAKYQVNQNYILIDAKKDLIILRDALKRPVSYIETPFTSSARENIKKINELSAYHSIVDGKGLHIHRKTQHRVFNSDFQHGGRFYGGEWQSLSGNDRLNLKVDNGPVVELDFSALHPTMLYAMNGISLEEDPYTLRGYSSEIRKFLKVVMLALINTGDKSKAKKAIQKMINFSELRKPNEVINISAPINDFINKHKSIAHLFCSDMGLQLQRLDAGKQRIDLIHFYQKDILVLGVHDSFIIRQDYGKMLCEIMEEVFFNKFNKKCKITKKAEKKLKSLSSLIR